MYPPTPLQDISLTLHHSDSPLLSLSPPRHSPYRHCLPTTTMDKKRSKKSTLTQQQRNNKRQRANASQLDVLRHEYRLCATPDAATRRRISGIIDMTERSVQIWFQNTRAKQKKAMRGGKDMSRESSDVFDDEEVVGLGIDCEDLSHDMTHDIIATPIQPHVNFAHVLATPPISMGQQFATPQTGGSHITDDSPVSHMTTPEMTFGHVTPNLTPTTPSHVTLPPIFFPTLSLTIGNWRRLSPQLSLAYYPSTDSMSYHMTSDKTQFRMQFPFSAVKEIHVSRNPNDTLGALNLTLNCAPTFSIMMEKSSGRWVGCHDFSEGKQASHIMTHICNGPATVLQQQLSRVFALRKSDGVRCLTPPSMPAGEMGHFGSNYSHVSMARGQVDTDNHVISSHVGDFPMPHSDDLDHMNINMTSTILGNVTPGHTTPVLDAHHVGFDLSSVADLDQLVNAAHLLQPNHHLGDDLLTGSCHMMAPNAFTLDPSTPLSPFSGTLDYLDYL